MSRTTLAISLKNLLTFILHFLLIIPLYNQSVNWMIDPVAIDEGISDLRVNCILEDHQGFIWFGTDDGLNRFDGYDYKVYQHIPSDSTSLPSSKIEEIYQDRNGNIWIGTMEGKNGLCRYEPRIDGFIQMEVNPGSQSSTNITSIAETKDGYLWLGSWGAWQGLIRFDPATRSLKHFKHDPENSNTLSDGVILLIYEDQQENLWVGTGAPWMHLERGGLNLYHAETGTFTRFQHDPDNPASLQNNVVLSALEDSRGDFWIGTGQGLHLMNREEGIFQFLPYNEANEDQLSGPSFGPLNAIHEDQYGQLWFGGDGIVSFDPKTEKIKHHQNYKDLRG